MRRDVWDKGRRRGEEGNTLWPILQTRLFIPLSFLVSLLPSPFCCDCAPLLPALECQVQFVCGLVYLLGTLVKSKFELDTALRSSPHLLPHHQPNMNITTNMDNFLSFTDPLVQLVSPYLSWIAPTIDLEPHLNDLRSPLATHKYPITQPSPLPSKLYVNDIITL